MMKENHRRLFFYIVLLLFGLKLYLSVFYRIKPMMWVMSPYKFFWRFSPDLLLLGYASPIGRIVKRYVTKKVVWGLSVFFWLLFMVFIGHYGIYKWWLINGLIYIFCFYGCFYYQSRGTNILQSGILSYWSVVLVSLLWELPFAVQRGEILNASYFLSVYGFAIIHVCLFISFNRGNSSEKQRYVTLSTTGYGFIWLIAFSLPYLPCYHQIRLPIGYGIYVITVLGIISRILTTIFILSINYRRKKDE